MTSAEAAAQAVTISCRDACGRSVADDQLEHSGWTFLAIARRWRCPACTRALYAVNAPTPAVAEEGASA